MAAHFAQSDAKHHRTLSWPMLRNAFILSTYRSQEPPWAEAVMTLGNCTRTGRVAGGSGAHACSHGHVHAGSVHELVTMILHCQCT